MARLSGAAVLLLVVVPLCTCAFLVGVQVGRALERSPGRVFFPLGIEEAVGYVVVEPEELWDTDISGRGRDGSASRHPYTRWVPFPQVNSATLKAQGCNGDHTLSQQAETTRIAAQQRQQLMQKQQQLIQLQLQQLMQAPRRTNPTENQRRARDERWSSMQSKHLYKSWSVPLPPDIKTVTPETQRYDRNHNSSQQAQASRIAAQEQREQMLILKQHQRRQQMLLKLQQQMHAPRQTNPPDVLRRSRDETFPMQTKHLYYTSRSVPLPPGISTVTPEAQSCNRNHTSPRGVTSVGPWGGSSGQPFYIHGESAPRLHSIILHHSSSVILSLAYEYSLAGDDGAYRMLAGPWGRIHYFHPTGSLRAKITLSSGEHVTAVEGTIGHFASFPGVITSLTFRTSHGRTYGPYGNKAAGAGTPFSVPAADGACIVGFWGRSGWLIDAIGVYVRPC